MALVHQPMAISCLNAVSNTQNHFLFLYCYNDFIPQQSKSTIIQMDSLFFCFLSPMQPKYWTLPAEFWGWGQTDSDTIWE